MIAVNGDPQTVFEGKCSSFIFCHLNKNKFDLMPLLFGNKHQWINGRNNSYKKDCNEILIKKILCGSFSVNFLQYNWRSPPQNSMDYHCRAAANHCFDIVLFLAVNCEKNIRTQRWCHRYRFEVVDLERRVSSVPSSWFDRAFTGCLQYVEF